MIDSIRRLNYKLQLNREIAPTFLGKFHGLKNNPPPYDVSKVVDGCQELIGREYGNTDAECLLWHPRSRKVFLPPPCRYWPTQKLYFCQIVSN